MFCRLQNTVISRGVLSQKMEKLEIQGRFLKAINKIYQETLNAIITGKGITDI